MRHAELLGDRALAGGEVDADDLVGADHAGALDDVEADAAEPEHRDVGARPDLGGVDHRPDAGRDKLAVREGDLGPSRVSSSNPITP